MLAFLDHLVHYVEIEIECTRFRRIESGKPVKLNIYKGTLLTWTGSKRALLELIYALFLTMSINNGKISIKELVGFFSHTFNISLPGYHKQKKNVYMKDMDFDSKGNPVVLYIRSNGYKPGPESTPYEWCVTFWDGKAWQTTVVTESDHNYDMGSLFIAEDNWSIVGPTEQGTQAWGVGGELAIWQSSDQGATWQKKLDVTKHSKRAHSYVRRPLNFKAPFCFFWADGHSHDFSKSELYFGNFNGTIYKLPYTMEGDFAKPERISQ